MKKQIKKQTPGLPKRIYVKLETDTDEPYLIADESADSMENGERVGVYELVEMKTMRVTRELK